MGRKQTEAGSAEIADRVAGAGKPMPAAGAPAPGAPANGHMRAAMPLVTAWIDDLRLAFGHADVTNWMREGLATGTFYARENGHEVGKPIPPAANAVCLADMILPDPVKPAAPARAAAGSTRATARR